jgi:hypothetical protein
MIGCEAKRDAERHIDTGGDAGCQELGRTCGSAAIGVASGRRCIGSEGGHCHGEGLWRVFGASLVVVGLALLVASLVQGISGN